MKKLLILIGILITGFSFGQESKTSDFLSGIQQYNISDLWTLDKFQAEDDTVYIDRQEPLGYIGDNYQRLFIHFISVIQNPKNKLEYFVYGKTCVKNNICSFQGFITINDARTYNEGDLPPLKQGYVKGDYNFFEDSKQKGTGIFKGNFQTNFYIDQRGKIKYDALMFVADGFENNQFEGIWTSYKIENSKKCNWGDYRIPDSRGFDNGTGEFSPWEKYEEFGWKNYRNAWGCSPDKPETQEARKKEKEKWWMDK